MNIPTILSYVGALLVLAAFSLISFKKITTTSITYQLLNGFGAAFLAYSAFSTKSYAFVMLNSVWAMVAILSFVRNREGSK
jgi:hypothetical protein